MSTIDRERDSNELDEAEAQLGTYMARSMLKARSGHTALSGRALTRDSDAQSVLFRPLPATPPVLLLYRPFPTRRHE